MAKDLVCGMEINENAANYSSVFEGETYFFCSEGCRAEFGRRPQDYLKPGGAAACGGGGGDGDAPEEKEKNRNV